MSPSLLELIERLTELAKLLVDASNRTDTLIARQYRDLCLQVVELRHQLILSKDADEPRLVSKLTNKVEAATRALNREERVSNILEALSNEISALTQVTALQPLSITGSSDAAPPPETFVRPSPSSRQFNFKKGDGASTRYANAVLMEVGARRPLDQSAPLRPGSIVRLRLDIGKLSKESQVQPPEPFPEQKLPRDVNLYVMVSSSEFTISSQRYKTTAAAVAHGHFFLPGDGTPARNPDGGRFVNFYLGSPEQPGVARCRIGYYYLNILVQSQQLVATVGQRGGFKIETDFTTSADLTHLGAIPEQPRVSVLTNSNGAGAHQIVLRSLDPSTANIDGKTFQVTEANIGTTIRQFRATLAERAPTQKQRRPPELAEDLRQFAQHGWTLYTQIPGQCTHMFQPLFDQPDGFVVQVLRPTTSGFVFPWSLVYEIPLNTDRPELCRLVSEWDGIAPLIEGAPRDCPFGPHEADVLCPFGFWGFRYAIEQLASTDMPITSISTGEDFRFAVAETQYGVDLDALAKHVDSLRQALHSSFPGAQLREGKDKKSIKALLADDLPLVYFYCHGERRNVADPNTWLGIGKQEALTTKEFIGWIVSWQRIQKKCVWNQLRPLIFVNACHSMAVYPETLISYLDAFVGTAHAAGVIGTEVKVHQQLAMDVAQRFFEMLLSQEHSVESALRTIRLHYLAHGNLLGLVYTPYCWADLRLAVNKVA